MCTIQVQYIFLHKAILDEITSIGTDIPVDKLEEKISELSRENEEGDSGFAAEFNVSPEKLSQTYIDICAQICRVHFHCHLWYYHLMIYVHTLSRVPCLYHATIHLYIMLSNYKK